MPNKQTVMLAYEHSSTLEGIIIIMKILLECHCMHRRTC